MNLQHYIGITKTEDDPNLKESVSGVYVDADPGFQYCQFSAWPLFWATLADMRAEAVLTLQTDLAAGWRSKLKRLDERQELIGQPDTSGLLPLQEEYGLDIKTATWGQYGPDFRKLWIDSVAIMGTVVDGGTVDITLTVTNENTGVEVGSVVFPGVGSRQTLRRPIAEPIELVVDGSVYNVRYTASGDFQALNNKYHCGCGDKLKGLAGYILENIGPAQGLSMLVKAGCPKDALLELQLTDEAFGLVMANMIRNLTLANMLIWISKKPDVNRYTLLDNEGVAKAIADYQAAYQSRLDWVLTEAPITDGWCYRCTTRMQRTSMSAGPISY